MKMYNGNVMTA